MADARLESIVDPSPLTALVAVVTGRRLPPDPRGTRIRFPNLQDFVRHCPALDCAALPKACRRALIFSTAVANRAQTRFVKTVLLIFILKNDPTE
jgi:hypothetical protein